MIDIILFLIGLLGHQTKRFTKDIESVGYQRITEHVVGAVMIYAALKLVFKFRKCSTFEQQYAEAVLPMGLAVAFNWALDDLLGIANE